MKRHVPTATYGAILTGDHYDAIRRRNWLFLNRPVGTIRPFAAISEMLVAVATGESAGHYHRY